MPGALYLVATPIGNLGDFSPRAIEVLSQADLIAAEDTRVSLKLLNHFGIKKSLFSYHEHNQAEAGEKLLELLLEGKQIALVTDAGMPAISDPGEGLVRLCADNHVPVFPIPGCCALISALAVSGLPTGRFTFEGFLPATGKERRDLLQKLKSEERTMIFHEAPHRLLSTLEDFENTFGSDRRMSLSRELTKLHEETLRMTCAEAVAYFKQNPPKGEFVLCVEGSTQESLEISMEDAIALILRKKENGIRLKDACREVSQSTGFPVNELYQRAVKEG